MKTHALNNATVVVQPGEILENSTIVLRDGLIESIGKFISVPEDA